MVLGVAFAVDLGELGELGQLRAAEFKARGDPILSASMYRSRFAVVSRVHPRSSSSGWLAKKVSGVAAAAGSHSASSATPGWSFARSQWASDNSASRRILLMSRLPSTRCTRSGYLSLSVSTDRRKRRSPGPLSTESPPTTRWHVSSASARASRPPESSTTSESAQKSRQ